MNQLRAIEINSKGLQDSELEDVIGDSRGVGLLQLCSHFNNIGGNNFTYQGVEILAQNLWDNLTILRLGIPLNTQVNFCSN